MRGKRILVLRPSHQAEEVASRLEARAATPVLVPAIEIGPPQNWGPVDQALRSMDGFDWVVFTSVNGVEATMGRARELGLEIPVPRASRVGAVGPATARALSDAAIGGAWTPRRYTTEALALELPLPADGRRVLLFRVAGADSRLEEMLQRRGFEVARVDAYTTTPADPGPVRSALERGVEAVLLTSASIARAFAAAAGKTTATAANFVLASIGPATTAECLRQGIRVDVEASEHTIEGLIEALAAHFGDTP